MKKIEKKSKFRYNHPNIFKKVKNLFLFKLLMKRFVYAGFLMLAMLVFLPSKVAALGFEITPARYERTVHPGEVIESALTVTNRGEAITAQLDVHDFTFQDDSGAVKILDDNVVDVNNYSLQNWITFPDQVEIGEDKKIEKVSSKDIIDKMIHNKKYFAKDFKEVRNILQQINPVDSVILFIGAGDIDDLARELASS